MRDRAFAQKHLRHIAFSIRRMAAVGDVDKARSFGDSTRNACNTLKPLLPD